MRPRRSRRSRPASRRPPPLQGTRSVRERPDQPGRDAAEHRGRSAPRVLCRGIPPRGVLRGWWQGSSRRPASGRCRSAPSSGRRLPIRCSPTRACAGGQADAVIAVLKPAYAQRPADDELRQAARDRVPRDRRVRRGAPDPRQLPHSPPGRRRRALRRRARALSGCHVDGAELSAADRAKLLAIRARHTKVLSSRCSRNTSHRWV